MSLSLPQVRCSKAPVDNLVSGIFPCADLDGRSYHHNHQFWQESVQLAVFAERKIADSDNY